MKVCRDQQHAVDMIVDYRHGLKPGAEARSGYTSQVESSVEMSFLPIDAWLLVHSHLFPCFVLLSPIGHLGIHVGFSRITIP